MTIESGAPVIVAELPALQPLAQLPSNKSRKIFMAASPFDPNENREGQPPQAI
ncbi:MULTISPECIES: hypothetical protein [Rhizobium]|uniref:Uncharacterized protein n=1 Tax=Rhizobium rhododendri TaxID=2506430 RepID=A0ABY8IMT1_9HYPH|nr:MULTISPECIES: hypothetical protein [Rhizobium]MBO9101255.1 hypothetical protein [Rhizobium sp. L58/93]MBO9135284.1 hypothetical protein [Rhizobium sp. B209b/85]MBO9171512.1 hypothetical protein [Rhizobium sp. L245/93]MBO9187379.1 hypothetical protein [Rhizobium sp. E27B/91]QXZ80822.1 hypothetical protein J5274_23995 [Rhizobium sp. L51/94]